MDVVKALKIPLRNREKFPKFELIGLVPILNFATIGYAIESTSRRTKLLGLLPQWDVKQMWVKGLKAGIVMITYLLISGLLGAIFDFFYLNILITLAAIYMIPKAILQETIKDSFTQPIKTVWNMEYLMAFFQGLLAEIIVAIPMMAIIFIAALTNDFTIIDVVSYLLAPAYMFYAAIPFLLLISEAQN